MSGRGDSERPVRMMLESSAARLLERNGLPYVEHGLAHSPDEAAAIAARIGHPVVLKVMSPDVIHKSDVGGVITGLADSAAVLAAYPALISAVMSRCPDATIHGVLVCRQMATGRELILGALRDSVFGVTVMVGFGGVFAEALSDVTFRLAPLSAQDGLEMLQELRCFPVLKEFRGHAPVDLQAISLLLVSLGSLVLSHEDIVEVDLNPVAASSTGCVALDARIMCG